MKSFAVVVVKYPLKMTTLRVRQVLESMDVLTLANLKKQLPKKLKMPEAATAKYPSALLNCFPEGEDYSYLGIIAEHLLRLPSANIHLEKLLEITRSVYPLLTPELQTKLRKSKTTQPFLDCLVETRKELEKVLLREGEDLEFEPRITSGSLEGHPDMKNTTQVFEVKLTGMLKKNWTSFLFQVFAYGAICPEVTDLYLVLPLQKTVWHADISSWTSRNAFLEILTSFSTKKQTTFLDIQMAASLLCHLYQIGFHAGKQKTITNTIRILGDFSKPYQIFLSGPMSSQLNAPNDEDLASALGLIDKTHAKIYTHSPYVINLCTQTEDSWNTNLLIKNLQITRAFGGKGVVVHVGKSTTQTLETALESMRYSIQACLEHATVDCPLLLETPAGQGTEMLTSMVAFLDFVESFADPRLRMCLDTCHVYACGHQPLDYIDAALARKDLLKLIHFNDSLGACGSCVDRHAHIGTGQIGLETMTKIAEKCHSAGLPMVIE